MHPSHTSGVNPPPDGTTTENVTDAHRGMLASSIDLVQSYSRSQAFSTENLSSSLSHSSFATRYQVSRDPRDAESQWEADDEDEDGRSLTPTGEDDYYSDEGPEMSSLDGELENRQLIGTSRATVPGVRPNVSDDAPMPSSGFQRFWIRRMSANLYKNRVSTSSLRKQASSPTSPDLGRPAGSSQRSLSHTERSGLLPSSLSIRRYDSVSNSSPNRLVFAESTSTHGPSRNSRNRRIGFGHLSHRRSSLQSGSTTNQSGLSAPPPGAGTSTFGQSLFNGFNILCGVGLLSEPLGFACAGWVGSVVIFLFCGLATNYTAKILARAMFEDRSLLTYNDICYKAFGRSMQLPVAGLFCLELFSLSVAMMVIFGDSMAIIFPGYGPTLFKLLAFCLVLPTTFMPFKMLSYTSLIGFCSTVTLVSVVIFDGLYKQDAPGSIFQPAPTSLWPDSRWGLSAGLIMSGFGGHAVIPSLARDMRNPQEFNRVIDWAYLSAGLMYVIIGVAGYMMFGDSVSQEITHDILVTPGFPPFANQVAIWMFAINPIAKFALCTRPLNLTVERLLSPNASELVDAHAPPSGSRVSRDLASAPSPALNGFSPKNSNGELVAPQDMKAMKTTRTPTRLIQNLPQFISRLSVTVLAVAVSIIMPDFDRVMAFLGAFSAFVICVILPVSADLLLHKDHLSKLTLGIEITLLIVSVAVASIGTAFSLLPKKN